MLNCRWFANIWIVLVVLNEYAFGIPHDGESKTKSRILTNPPKFEYGEEQEIVFPDDSEEQIDVVSRIDVSPTCTNGLPVCEEVDSYPFNHLKRVLQQNPMLKVLFGQDEVPHEIANRIGDDDERFMCRTMTKTIFPKIGQNKNNKWKFIINQGKDDGFIQGVQIEVCKNPDGECDLPGSLLVSSGYHTFCKQKYVYRRLLSVSNEGTPVPDTFKIPSACCCAYKQNLDFLSRLGRGSKNKTNS